MPNVRMSDGTVIANVPDGVTQAQLQARYDLYSNKGKKPAAAATAPAPVTPAPKPLPPAAGPDPTFPTASGTPMPAEFQPDMKQMPKPRIAEAAGQGFVGAWEQLQRELKSGASPADLFMPGLAQGVRGLADVANLPFAPVHGGMRQAAIEAGQPPWAAELETDLALLGFARIAPLEEPISAGPPMLESPVIEGSYKVVDPNRPQPEPVPKPQPAQPEPAPEPAPVPVQPPAPQDEPPLAASPLSPAPSPLFSGFSYPPVTPAAPAKAEEEPAAPHIPPAEEIKPAPQLKPEVPPPQEPQDIIQQLAGDQFKIELLDPDNIQVDAPRFQFKSNANVYGVTDRLMGVETFDNYLSGVVLVYRDKAGASWIANGHQRLALAKRAKAAGQPDVFLNARVIKESEGWTEDEARMLGAYINIAEGTGTSIDAAKIFREPPSERVKFPELPPRSVLVRDGQALAKLGQEAWGMAVNELIPPNQAAIVGRLITDPAQQAEAMRLLHDDEPDNLRQAESIVRDILYMGTEKMKTQGGLFGEEEFAASAVPQRAKILDGTAKLFGTNKKVFGTLVRETGRIEAGGKNVLNEEFNKGQLSTNDAAAALLTQLATRHGPVSDALTGLAKRVKAGSLSNAEAVKQFAKFVTDSMEKGLPSGLPDPSPASGSAGGEENQPGFLAQPDESLSLLFNTEPGATDAKGNPLPQLIIPGAERSAVQAQKAREAEAKGRLTAKKPQKEAGPLFAPGEGAGGGKQGTLFQPGKESEFDRMLRINKQYRDLGQEWIAHLRGFVARGGVDLTNVADVGEAITSFLTAFGNRTGHEALVNYEVTSGMPVHVHTHAEKDMVGVPQDITTLHLNPNANYAIYHNHPAAVSLSGEDIGLMAYPGLRGIIAVSPDGNWYGARLTSWMREKIVQAQRAAPGHDTANATIEQIMQLRKKVLVVAKNALAQAADNGNLDPNEGNRHGMVTHLVNLMLDKTGLITYTFSKVFPAHLQKVLDDALTRVGTVDPILPYRPPGHVQFREGIAGFLGVDPRPAGPPGGAVGAGGSAGQSAAGAGAGKGYKKPVQLKLLQPGFEALASE